MLLDALLIRCVIVPAVLRLMGTRAWWLPRWLDRILPTIALEREEPVEEEPNQAELVGSEVRR